MADEPSPLGSNRRAFYNATIKQFQSTSIEEIIGTLSQAHSQDLTHAQTVAWRTEITLLRDQLAGYSSGQLFLELVIPRMGRRADGVILLGGKIFVLEFKIGASIFDQAAMRQVEGYAHDLANFHEASHRAVIVPVLICTNAADQPANFIVQNDQIYRTIVSNGRNLGELIDQFDALTLEQPELEPENWIRAGYHPSPSIVEAAQALYAKHNVRDISRSDAGATNLSVTSERLIDVIRHSRLQGRKSICFVTGVPGSGKTLVGLNLATRPDDEHSAVFLSGNGPLVDVLREALIRDEIARTPGLRRRDIESRVKSFIQNVHHFRDEALLDDVRPPSEHVVVFDEAQRAWDLHNTRKFMINKRGATAFNFSEPEFLVGYMDRHDDWCVVVALVGGGQEINTGEAGLEEWKNAIERRFPHWDVYFSNKIRLTEFSGTDADFSTLLNNVLCQDDTLHLSTSLRSFRSERVSAFVHKLIANSPLEAARELQSIAGRYPVFVTRHLDSAKEWVRSQVRGVDSSGVIASSGAQRLKARGLFVKNEIDLPLWFLNSPEDVRSCHALEDVATEFGVQGLELDWTIVAWDADLRHSVNQFEHWDFKGSRWTRRHTEVSRRYLENAYRVLLTRARQGMVIFVPEGSGSDPTRDCSFYDGTYEYLRSCGIRSLDVG